MSNDESEKMKHKKASAVGINHVSIEVGNIQEALDFYTSFLDCLLDDVAEDRASLEMGDQFIALTLIDGRNEISEKHFGLVVDDSEAAKRDLIRIGANILPGRFLRILDPWNNLIEVVDYRNIRFTKTQNSLNSLGLPKLGKSEKGKLALSSMPKSRS